MQELVHIPVQLGRSQSYLELGVEYSMFLSRDELHCKNKFSNPSMINTTDSVSKLVIVQYYTSLL